MKIKIRINSAQGVQDTTDVLELDMVSPTLGSVLERVSQDYQKGRCIVNPAANDIDSEECSILLNGSSYQFLPQKLLTPLSEGDEVQLFRWFELLGGG